MLGREAFDILFEDTLMDSNSIHGSVIIIDGKLWVDSHYKRFIFPNKVAATKAFYHSMKWYVSSIGYRYSTHNRFANNYENNTYVFTEDEYNICRDWRAFKKDLVDNHGFTIVNI